VYLIKMTETNEYKIISTSCPLLNKKSRTSQESESSNLDVLLLSNMEKLTNIICAEYDRGNCNLINTHSSLSSNKCIYSRGWKILE